MAIWLKVTMDEYELPLAVGYSAEDLAEQVGTTQQCVISSYSKYKRGKIKKSPYRKVEEITDDEL